MPIHSPVPHVGAAQTGDEYIPFQFVPADKGFGDELYEYRILTADDIKSDGLRNISQCFIRCLFDF